MINKLIYLVCIVLTISSCGYNNESNNDHTYKNTTTTKESIALNKLQRHHNTEITRNNTQPTFTYNAIIKPNVAHLVTTTIDSIKTKQSAIDNNTDPPYFPGLPPSKKQIETKPNILQINFDNDIFTNTDYYYTNGVNISVVTPMASSNPVNAIFPGRRNADISMSGFSICQNIYTPTDPDVEEIRYGDRPFAGLLTIGQFNRNTNFKKRLNISSSINFGILGPASMGEFVQSSIHNIEPVGWHNQIQNNIVADYNINIEKGLVNTTHFELNAMGGAQAGTVFNNISAGIYTRTGSFIPVYRGVDFFSKSRKNKLQYWLFFQAKSNIVLYDATLQGGIFNNNNPYTIAAADINRLVMNFSTGMAFYYNTLGVEFHCYYTTPEFNNAKDFMWGSVVAVYNF